MVEYAEILRKSFWAKESQMGDVLALARRTQEEMPGNAQVAEFVTLVEQATELSR